MGGGAPLVDRARDGTAAAGDAGLGSLDQLVHGLGDLVERTLGPVAAALRRSDRRLNSAFDRVAQSIGELSGVRGAPSHRVRSLARSPDYRAETVSLDHHIRALHLNPATELAERVLLPGDPHRALAVAQVLLDQPKMFNHRRGLWGYTGTAADGELLTIQSTGMGGPSATIVCEELIALGARRLLRIGTCGALDPRLPLGTLIAVEAALPADGASAALGADGTLRADPQLTNRLIAAGAQSAMAVSTDLFYDPREAVAREWIDRGARVVEMEAAAIFQVAQRREVVAACVLGVSDVPAENGSRRVSSEELEAIGVQLGNAGYAALSSER
jgi:uridine phosphorylase